MTSEYTPGHEEAKNWYAHESETLELEFERFVRKVQADAFAEGFAACAYWWEIHHFESVATTSNPYIAEYRV